MDRKNAKKSKPKKQANKKQNASKSGGAKAARQRTDRVGSKYAGTISAEVQAVAVEHIAEREKALELAKAMCCPNLYPSFGVQDGYQSQPTGASSPVMCEPGSFNTTDGTGNDANNIQHDNAWAFAYRDPHCALRYYDGALRSYEYNGVMDDGTTAVTLVANAAVEFDAWNLEAGVDVHGDKLYVGVKNTGPGAGQNWVLWQKTEDLRVSGLPASTLTVLSFQTLYGDEVKHWTVSATSSAGGVATFDISTAVAADGTTMENFFHLGGISVNQVVTAGQFRKEGVNIPVLRQMSLARYDDVKNVVEKLRFCALNLMFSNTAPALSRNGFIAAWQVPSNIEPFEIIKDGFDALANNPGADRIVADEGAHALWKSSDPLDWEYLNTGDPVSGGSGGGNYHIDGQSDYLAMCTSIPIAAGRAGYWTIFSDVQYRHDSPWLPLEFPDHNRRTFEMALEIVGPLPFLHCNPFHIKDIFKWVGQRGRDAGNWIGKHKGQLQATGQLINQATGYKSAAIVNPTSDFLDIWFK